MDNLKPLQKLKPFAHVCCTIGHLPASYMTSLTYEEQLLWLCKYLEETLIPTVDNNTLVVEELQELYIELRNYLDNYFDNLDVQDEINQKLDEMAQNGVLEPIVEQSLKKAPLQSIIDSQFFAQVIPDIEDAGYMQCFAISDDGLLVGLFAKDPEDNHNLPDDTLVCFNIKTGEFIKSNTNLVLGHGATITYCKKDDCFYVACMNINKIKVIDKDLNIIREVDTTKIYDKDVRNVWSITYNYVKDTFITIFGYDFYELNYELDTVLNKKPLIQENITTTPQSLFFDGEYIYMVMNYGSNISSYYHFNKINVYYQDLSFHCSQKLTMMGEAEAGAIYNNELYINTIRQNISFIYKCSLRQNEKIYTFLDENLVIPSMLPYYSATKTVYIDRTYKGFFVDGSEQHPFNNFYIALSVNNSPYPDVRFNLKGDFSDCFIRLPRSL